MVVPSRSLRGGTVDAANSVRADIGEIRMNETMITMSGVVVTDLKKGEARGASVVSFRLLSTVRRWERGKGWFDADHNFVTVTCWRGLADNVSSSVKKGDPVLVAGRMRVRPWDTADREGSTVEIEANSIGHDLSRGTSSFRKHKDAEPERAEGDEQLKQVRWHVEEQSRSAERAVLPRLARIHKSPWINRLSNLVGSPSDLVDRIRRPPAVMTGPPKAGRITDQVDKMVEFSARSARTTSAMSRTASSTR
jgi:single-stranded DNA-binding protein